MSFNIEKLAQSFPSLENAEGISPWNPTVLDQWVIGPEGSSISLHAGRFLLALWDREAAWNCGPFDVFNALAEWDRQHRAAFLHWAENPWWPQRP